MRLELERGTHFTFRNIRRGGGVWPHQTQDTDFLNVSTLEEVRKGNVRLSKDTED